MKKISIKTIVLFALFTFCAQLNNPVHAAPIHTPVQMEVLFLPQDTIEMLDKLNELLNNTKKQLLVAMYWITDENFINQLIELKKNGVDVQVIFDESSPNSSEILYKFLDNDIIPTLLSPQEKNGLMHNKFIVFDNEIVWTGSANLTKTVLNPNTNFKNDENVIILHSEDCAASYQKNFNTLKDALLKFYVDLLAKTRPEEINEWIKIVTKNLLKNNPPLIKYIKAEYRRLNQARKNKISKFFSEIDFQEEPITQDQELLLQAIGYDTSNMTEKEANDILFDELSASDIQGPPNISSQESLQSSEPLADKQTKILSAQEVNVGDRIQKKARQLIRKTHRSAPYKKKISIEQTIH